MNMKGEYRSRATGFFQQASRHIEMLFSLQFSKDTTKTQRFTRQNNLEVFHYCEKCQWSRWHRALRSNLQRPDGPHPRLIIFHNLDGHQNPLHFSRSWNTPTLFCLVNRRVFIVSFEKWRENIIPMCLDTCWKKTVTLERNSAYMSIYKRIL